MECPLCKTAIDFHHYSKISYFSIFSAYFNGKIIWDCPHCGKPMVVEATKIELIPIRGE